MKVIIPCLLHVGNEYYVELTTERSRDRLPVGDRTRGSGKRGSIKNEGMEIARVDIAPPVCRVRKRTRNEYGNWKTKIPVL